METFVGERQESYFEPEDSDGARGSSDSNLSEKEDEVADRVERDDTKRVGRQDGESLKEISHQSYVTSSRKHRTHFFRSWTETTTSNSWRKAKKIIGWHGR